MLMGNPNDDEEKHMATRTKPKPEVIEEDVELDELEEDVEAEDTEPAANAVTFGASDLARHLSEVTGKEIKARDLRTLIRKMARDGSGRVNREITAGNRTRYDWADGLKDPEVKAIVKAVKAGELEQGKKEALDALKARKAEQKAAGTTKTKKSKPAPAAVEEVDDDEELEDDDED
jgi:hypothetical protein